MKEKLEDLDKKINNLSNKFNENKRQKTKINSNIAVILNVLLELFCALIVGGFIGYGLDFIFKTKIVFLSVFLFLGLIAGIINLSRYIKKIK